MRADLIAVGEALLDVSVDRLEPDARLHAPVRVSVGGSAARSAVWAARAGVRAALVARVGDDPAGRLVRETLAAEGVQLSVAVDPAARTGTFVEAGSGSVADRGASARLAPADLPERLDAPAVLVSRYAPEDVLLAAVERAAGPWIASGRPIARATVLLLNEEEARNLTGLDPEAALAVLSPQHRLVCVTLGARGALAAAGGELYAHPAASVDGPATGAGDAFAAGLLVALVRGAELGDALAEGCRLGALAVSARER